MSSINDAWNALKARLAAPGSGITIPLRFPGDLTPLPDTPSAYAYVELINDGSGGGPTAFGGGNGGNLYRNFGAVEIYVFSPLGEGQEVVNGYAETIAAWLRSYRTADIFIRSADTRPIGEGSGIAPPGLSNPVNNYQCALVSAAMTFDQFG
jgi:hypothetical protein